MATGRVPTTANSPLTAKGDLFGYSTTQARLAVGNNGETLVADSSTSTGLRWSPAPSTGNPVLNSAFQIWQRGTSITPTTTSYSADRWFAYRGVGNSTVSRQATNDTTNLPFIQYCARVGRNSGDTSTVVFAISQSFESINSIAYAGRTVTFSFYARAGANYSATGNALQAALGSGTGTDQNLTLGFTGYTTVANPSATLTTTWQRFSATGTVPTNATQLGFFFQHNPTGTAGANDWFEVTGVQIDLGSVALPFRTYSATLAGELAACQRYYVRLGANSGSTTSAYQAYGSGWTTSTTNGTVNIPLPVTMRTAPLVTEFSNIAVQYMSGTLTAVSALAVNNSYNGAQIAGLDATTTGTTAGGFCRLTNNNSTAGYIGLGAEL